MATDKMILDSDHFIMLDVPNTISINKEFKGSPNVQIIYQVNKSSYQDIEATKNRIGNSLKLEEKRKDLFTITLNANADYENQLFR